MKTDLRPKQTHTVDWDQAIHYTFLLLIFLVLAIAIVFSVNEPNFYHGGF